MKKHRINGYEQAFREFEIALKASNLFDLSWTDETLRRLEEKIEAHCARPEHQGRRGVRLEVVLCVRRTLTQLAHASKHSWSHWNSQVRTNAKALLRSIQSQPFEQIRERASRHQGLVQKVGHKRKEEELLSRRPRLQAGRLTLVKQTSSDQLRSTGRTLRNCTAHRSSSYHAALRQGRSAFWAVEDRGDLVGLIEVDVEDGQIVQCGGRRDDALMTLTKRQALEVIRTLDVTADDDVETFSRVGASEAFLDCDETKPHLRVESERTTHRGRYRYYEYCLWFFPDREKLVVRTRKRCAESETDKGSVEGRPYWSLFLYSEPRADKYVEMFAEKRRRPCKAWVSLGPGSWEQSCRHEGAMDVEELVALMVRHPEICSTMHRLSAAGSESPARTMNERLSRAFGIMAIASQSKRRPGTTGESDSG